MARKRKRAKKIKIVERKLGREKAYGLYWGDGVIEIDPRQNPKQYFNSCVHEYLHRLYPDRKEYLIRKEANSLTNFLWDLNYRRTMQ